MTGSVARTARLAIITISTLGHGACESTRGAAPTPLPDGEMRVASGVVLADEVLWALGEPAHQRTIAVSALVDDPLYSAVADRWPKALPRLGPNPEQLVALGPSAVILAPFTHAEYRDAAAKRVPVVMLSSFASFDDYAANVRAIATTVDLTEAGEALIASFERRRTSLLSTRAPNSAWPTCLSYISGYAAAAGTTFEDISATAGCRNLASQRGLSGHAPLEVEQLLAWDPEVLVVQCPRSGCASALAELRAIPGMSGLGAVQRERIVAIDARALTSTGEGMLDATEQLRAGLAALGTD